MSEHRATIVWKRTSADFTYDSFNRDHVWHMEGGVDVPASSAPEYKGTLDRVDPERALVAALSSCHMLTFLALAARAGLAVEAYDDAASAWLEKGADRHISMTRAVLRPRVVFSPGVVVDAERLAKLHHDAHEGCFIACSVKTEITIEPR